MRKKRAKDEEMDKTEKGGKGDTPGKKQGPLQGTK